MSTWENSQPCPLCPVVDNKSIFYRATVTYSARQIAKNGSGIGETATFTCQAGFEFTGTVKGRQWQLLPTALNLQVIGRQFFLKKLVFFHIFV